MNRLIFLFALLFSLIESVFAVEQVRESNEASVEELSEVLLDMPLSKLCEAYLNPVNGDGQPVSPFRVSEALIEKRRLAAGEYTQTFNPFLVSGPEVENLKMQFDRLGSLVLGSGESLRTVEVPQLIVVDQFKMCEVEAHRRGLAEGGHLSVEQQEVMKRNLKENCMEEAFGRANPFANDIILSDRILFGTDRLAAEFAYHHELCHVQHPGIQGGYLEEIFCDARARLWMLDQGKEKTESLSETQLANSVREVLKPKNPYKDILVLRSLLPAHCGGAKSFVDIEGRN